MSIFSIGVDICDVLRIKKIEEEYHNRFLQKVYTTHEIQYCFSKHDKHASLAARFAAKEAFLKALGTGLRNELRWKDIEVFNDNLGKPSLRFYNHAAQLTDGQRVHLSLSHTKDNAIALSLE